MKVKLMIILILISFAVLGCADDKAKTSLYILVDADYEHNTTDVFVWTNATNNPQLCEPPECEIWIPVLGSCSGDSCDYDSEFDILIEGVSDVHSDLNETSRLLEILNTSVSQVTSSSITQGQLNSRLDMVLSDMGIQTSASLEDFEKRLRVIYGTMNSTHEKDLKIKELEGQYSSASVSLSESRKDVKDLQARVDGMGWVLILCLIVIGFLAIMQTNMGKPIRRFLNMG